MKQYKRYKVGVAMWATVLCWVVTPTIQAQEPVTYTLKSCLENGLQNNYSLRIVHNEEKISDNNATRANAGMLPTLDFTAGYNGDVNNASSTDRATGLTTKNKGVFDQTINVGLNLNWTLFDGFNILTNYEKLKELQKQGETNTRIAIEDFMADLAAEYYNFIQQKIRLRNLEYTTELSKEQMRNTELGFIVGNKSQMDYKQACIYFNTDSSQCIKQQEAINTSCIRLNQLMANADVDRPLVAMDSIITINTNLNFDDLWASTLAANASLLQSEQDIYLAQLDYKMVCSRNYPYLKLNAGYGYTYNKYDINSVKRRGDLGFNVGLTVGINIFDGNRRREKKNAGLLIDNARLQRQDLMNSLKANLNTLWKAYLNNLELIKLEAENLQTAKDYYSLALETYHKGQISGLELREALVSVQDAEESLLLAEYDAKLCEISLLQISGRITDYLQ